MKASDPLYQLIKTLSGAEKRYFKLNANKREGKKDYLHLFDFIDKQKEYDENKLKEEFKNRDFIKHIAVVKNYLFNAIIDSMHEFSSYDTAEFKIQDHLKKIHVLYQKGLIELCLKYIDKAKKIAEDHECFSDLIKLLEIQQQISLRNSSHLFNKRKEIQAELNLAVEKSYNLSQYSQLRLDVNAVLFGNATDKSSISEIQQHPLLSDSSMALSAKSREFYYRINSVICEQSGKLLEANEYTLKLLKNYESKPTLLNESPLMYARAINSYLQSAFGLRNFTHYDYYLSTLLSLEKLKISSEEKSVIKGLYYLNMFMRDVEYGNFAAIIDTSTKIETEVINNILVPIKIRFGILHQLFIAYFGNEQYKDALKLLNTSLATNDNIIPLLKRASKLFSIITLYELSYIDQLDNEILSLEKHLQTVSNTDGERILIKCMKKIINSIDKNERLVNFKQMRKELDIIFASAEKSSVLSLFDFKSWVEANINNTTFATVIKKNASPTQ